MTNDHTKTAAAGPTVGEALRAHRQANGLPDYEAEGRFWSYRLGPLTVWLPNFKWRRRSILAHDLHHLITGYPCTISGECQMAAWEFAAGPMPARAAAWFCLPLIPLGLILTPRKLWRAHLAGRRARSLHATIIRDDIFAAPLHELKARQAAVPSSRSRADYLSFAALIGRASPWIAGPAAAAAALTLLAFA